MAKISKRSKNKKKAKSTVDPKKFFHEVGLLRDPNRINKNRKKKESKFVEDLQREASVPTKKKFKFSKVMCEDLEYYTNKYNDDYEAMARDQKNIYQDSPGQLRYKIIKFKKLHQNDD